jgi:two-component system, NtrC family, nitrogen regulation sensor histidine kinase NtrY
MISRNLYLNIVARILLIVAISLLIGFLIKGHFSFRFIILGFIVIAILTVNLVYYLNATNRNIRFFFESVHNDDSSILFPTKTQDTTLRELYKGMNKVNQQIKLLKIENRNQEQFFQILLEHIATGIITYDDKGFIMHANSSVRKLLSVSVLTHLHQIENLEPKLYHAIRNIKPSERRLVSLSSDGREIQLAIKAAALNTKETQMMILSIEDIKNELDEKELESWMKLIRVLTHEIMNSITPIASLSESLSKIYNRDGNPISPADVDDNTISVTLKGLNVIRDQGKGLSSFVESYRKLTRIPEPDRKFFRVEDLLERLRILFSSMADNDRLVLNITVRESGIELFADQNLISQVLVNLVKNAIEANENNPGALIQVTAGLDSNNRPEICISDNGPGISPEHFDKIFVPFFTTRQNGSGIGLSISRQIMRIHGGNLRVRSVPGTETSFCMSF